MIDAFPLEDILRILEARIPGLKFEGEKVELTETAVRKILMFILESEACEAESGH